MQINPVFHTDTALFKGLQRLFQALSEKLELSQDIDVYLAGGMAVHLYTGERATTDVDAEFSSRVRIPQDLAVSVELEDGTKETLFFDTNYNSSFALMHEDYQDDSIPLDMGIERINLRVLSHLDLAVSKISRFGVNDKQDIAALVRLGLLSSSELEARAESAIGGFVGGLAMLKLNLRDAVALAKEVETATGKDVRADRCKG